MNPGTDLFPGRFRFYRFNTIFGFEPSRSQPDPNYSLEIWHPSLLTPWPRGVAAALKPHFVFRTLLHLSGTFPSGDSGAAVIYSGTLLVHYSAFTPRYFRFPFLNARDVQVGDTWTQPLHRGRGLAKQALRHLVVLLSQPERSIWYVVEEINQASVKVAEGCRFQLAGIGRRVKRFRGFDRYEITEAPDLF
jgi:GNAT superfamily N-acetyltransferase